MWLLKIMQTTFFFFKLKHSLLQLAFLGTVGGESTRDTVHRTMRLVLSTHLAQQLNWIGKGNTKTAFSNTKIQLIITSKNIMSYFYGIQNL